MRCGVCGTELSSTRTDLPFKLHDTAIVIVRDLPVLQCGNCPEYLLDDAVIATVDVILAHADGAAELEIVRYAA